MGSKYMITYKNYNSKCWYGEYQSNFFVLALLKLIHIRNKYELVDFNIRKQLQSNKKNKGGK